MRPSGRNLSEMRAVSIETDITKHAEGSCLIKVGDTHVICTASLEERVPPFIKGSGLGSLRAGVDRVALGERQITVDCDVIQADGGTRCAAITGGWVALRLAVNKLMKTGAVISDPLISPVAAVSCGIYAGQPVLDLDYPEDSEAGVDGNFILRGDGQLIEIQMSAEGATFSRDQMTALLDLAESGVSDLVKAQMAAVK